jgi:hypothetical protein
MSDNERAQRSMVREFARVKRRLEVRMAGVAAARSRDRSLCFGNLGIDALSSTKRTATRTYPWSSR